MKTASCTMALLALWSLAILGCDSGAPSKPVAQSSEAGAPAAPVPGGGDADAPEPEGTAAPGPPAAAAPSTAPMPPTTAPAQPAPEAAAPAPPAEGEVEKATRGAKGQGYKPGLISTPIEVMFRVQDRLVFETQIPEALKLYKAEHNNKGPKSHDEFMKLIIKANQISLPELFEGDEYEYDPKAEQLMIRHPKKD